MTSWYYTTYKTLPEGLQKRLERDQCQFSNCITKETAELVQKYLNERC